MSFYLLEESQSFCEIRLSKGNARFHFIFFRFYALFLIVLGVFSSWFLYVDVPDEKWLSATGLFAIVPGFMMLFFNYPLAVKFTDSEILKTTGRILPGNTLSTYPLEEVSFLAWKKQRGSFGGIRLMLVLKSGKKITVIQIPWLRLNMEESLEDFEKLASFSGLPLKQHK